MPYVGSLSNRGGYAIPRKENRLTVLLVGVGLPATPGVVHMLRSNPENMPVRIVGVDPFPDPIERHGLDAFFFRPKKEDASWAEWVGQLCVAEKVDVVIPLHDREALGLSRYRAYIEQSGAVLMSSSYSAVTQAFHKGDFMAACYQHKLPTPSFFSVRYGKELVSAALQLGYPGKDLVIKPAMSWGGHGVIRLSDRALSSQELFAKERMMPTMRVQQLEPVLDGSLDLLVMEHLPGTEYSVDCLRAGDQFIAIPRRRQEVVGGVAFATKIEEHKEIIEICKKASEVLDLSYIFGMQLLLDKSGVPRFIECNPRIHGTIIASYFSGVNLVWLGIQVALGVPIELPSAALTPASFRRTWGGVAWDSDWLCHL